MTGTPSRVIVNRRSASLPGSRPPGVEPDVVAAVADGRRLRRGERAQVGGAVDAQVGGERAGGVVVREVGEQPVRPGRVELDVGRPGAVGAELGVQVLEAREVAAGEDQVHALLVRDVEVADRPAVLVDDPEAQGLGAAAPQLGLVDDELQVVGGDAEPADGVGRVGGVGGGHVVLRLGGACRRILAVRLDRRTRERRAPEQQRERSDEGGDTKSGAALRGDYRIPPGVTTTPVAPVRCGGAG